MSVVLRWVVGILILGGIASAGLALSGTSAMETTGMSFVPDRPTAVRFERVGSVTPAASAAGLHVGDSVRFATPADEAAFYTRVRGTIVRFARRDGSIVARPLAPQPLTPPDLVFLIGSLLTEMLAFALVVRAWHDARGRELAIGFAFWAYVTAGFNLGPPWLSIVDPISYVLAGVSLPALTWLTTEWAATPPVAARVLRSLAAIMGIAYAAGALSPYAPHLRAASAVVLILMFVVMLAGIAVTLPRSRGTERRRLTWIAMTLFVSLAPVTAYTIASSFVPLGVPLIAIAWTTLVAPFGIAYSTLRHRVVDVGFALNRAAVFAVTTGLLVGLFGALQWGADQVLVRATGSQNFAVQMGIAVVVLYAVRLLRTQSDRLVTRLFFAGRVRRIDAIRSIAREVDAVQHPAAIPAFVVDALRERARIEAALFLAGTDGFVRGAGALGEERVATDAAIVVTLRATLLPARITPAGELGGAMVFPLAVRGQLRGSLVCALPDGDDDYAPDESDALARLAIATAIARDDLMAETLRSRVAELEQENRLLSRLAGLEARVSATSPFVPE
jgi:hypothetical protein